VTSDRRRWLEENAPADLRTERMPSDDRKLGDAVSYDALGVDPKELEQDDRDYRQRHRVNSSHEPSPPPETLTQSEYLEQLGSIPSATSSNQVQANPNRVIWSGGGVSRPAGGDWWRTTHFDHDLDPREELIAAIEESGEGADEGEFESNFEDWVDDDEPIDDRPLWQRELGLTDDDLEADEVADQLEPETEPSMPELCSHCNKKPIKYPGQRLCGRCYEYKRNPKHRGQLPPPRLTVGRRQR
jgi:hypothetical protein